MSQVCVKTKHNAIWMTFARIVLPLFCLHQITWKWCLMIGMQAIFGSVSPYPSSCFSFMYLTGLSLATVGKQMTSLGTSISTSFSIPVLSHMHLTWSFSVLLGTLCSIATLYTHNLYELPFSTYQVKNTIVVPFAYLPFSHSSRSNTNLWGSRRTSKASLRHHYNSYQAYCGQKVLDVFACHPILRSPFYPPYYNNIAYLTESTLFFVCFSAFSTLSFALWILDIHVCFLWWCHLQSKELLTTYLLDRPAQEDFVMSHCNAIARLITRYHNITIFYPIHTHVC